VLLMYAVVLATCLALLAAGVVEQRNHLANLRMIPTRVLVNGSRGKSSITRLCAGALRGGGLVVVAKTTGTAARLIYPDATEEPVYRKLGIANVIEQLPIVRRAVAFFPDALVMECMAVDPALQELNQAKLVRSRIGVVCNARDDHLAEMGPTIDDVARSLSRSMPRDGVCVTAERERIGVLREEAARRNCRLVEVNPESVSEAEMRGFRWITFKENVSIALAVAELAGVGRRAALEGMWAAPPDPGALGVTDFVVGTRLLRVANIFAANDPASTMMNIRLLRSMGAISGPASVIINCRPDRIERNGQMGALVAHLNPGQIFLIGEPTRSARATIPARWQPKVVDLGGRCGAQELVDGILASVNGHATLIAMGNIHGQGERLLEHLSRITAGSR
jgi:gamma-polyglutamate synthase